MDPMKAAVSMMNANGGLPSGAFGILSPDHPVTGINNALRGEMIPHGMATRIDIDTGVARSRRKLINLLVQGALWVEGAGVTGW
jgi:hypothetical protein